MFKKTFCVSFVVDVVLFSSIFSQKVNTTKCGLVAGPGGIVVGTASVVGTSSVHTSSVPMAPSVLVVHP